jgi:DNA-binding CsgD family transcriptional regulator
VRADAVTTSWRRTGVNVPGEMPRGHVCMFYETTDDLLDTVVPFFEAGLQNNEFCLWVCSGPLTLEEAHTALRLRLRKFDQHLAAGNIEIIPGGEWYLKDQFDLTKIMRSLDARLRNALAKGYEAVRASGDAFWVNTGHWKNFCNYEYALNKAIEGKPVMVLCTYPIMMSPPIPTLRPKLRKMPRLSFSMGAADVLNVTRAHQLSVVRRNGDWGLFETAPGMARNHSVTPDAKLVIGELLTARERNIINLIAQGQSNKEIARSLRITPETVKTHVRKIFTKLNVYKRPQAVALAQSLGIVKTPNTPHSLSTQPVSPSP